MATILLTDDEYTHIKTLHDELLAKIEKSTPRASTHYNNIVKACSKFLAREDGKRAEAATKKATRERQEQVNKARRAAVQAAAASGQSQASGTGSGTQAGRSGRPGEK